MKRLITLLALVLITGAVFAQKKTTTSATVSFDATTTKDNLPKAENNAVIASFNTQTGEVAFEAAVKNFSFSNPQMQQHFNGPQWFQSDTYPTFTFTGKIEDNTKVKYTKDGVYTVKVNGSMKVKDITNKLKVIGTITVKGGKITVASSFRIKLVDYKISGVPVDSGKVGKEPKVTVKAEF
jgi:polyisoprenoid-binding protein YceI